MRYMRAVSVLNRSGDAPTSILLQFIGTFGVWLLADRLGLSGILTIVAYAITIARRAPAKTPGACGSHPMRSGKRQCLC